MKPIKIPSFGNPKRMEELKEEKPVKIPRLGIYGFHFGNHAEFRLAQDEDNDRIIYVEIGWRNRTIFQVKFYLETK